jgi:hypothetical protein
MYFRLPLSETSSRGSSHAPSQAHAISRPGPRQAKAKAAPSKPAKEEPKDGEADEARQGKRELPCTLGIVWCLHFSNTTAISLACVAVHFQVGRGQMPQSWQIRLCYFPHWLQAPKGGVRTGKDGPRLQVLLVSGTLSTRLPGLSDRSLLSG